MYSTRKHKSQGYLDYPPAPAEVLYIDAINSEVLQYPALDTLPNRLIKDGWSRIGSYSNRGK